MVPNIRVGLHNAEMRLIFLSLAESGTSLRKSGRYCWQLWQVSGTHNLLELKQRLWLQDSANNLLVLFDRNVWCCNTHTQQVHPDTFWFLTHATLPGCSFKNKFWTKKKSSSQQHWSTHAQIIMWWGWVKRSDITIMTPSPTYFLFRTNFPFVCLSWSELDLKLSTQSSQQSFTLSMYEIDWVEFMSL